jgi:hypothetical protein
MKTALLVAILACPFLPAKWQHWVGLVPMAVCVLLAIGLWPWSLVRRALQASDSPRTLGQFLPLVVEAIGWICGLNILSFFFDSWILGGDAASGCIVDGHYYLSPHPGCHVRIEVSHAVFQYSLWHVRSVLITYAAIVTICIVGVLKSIRER